MPKGAIVLARQVLDRGPHRVHGRERAATGEDSWSSSKAHLGSAVSQNPLAAAIGFGVGIATAERLLVQQPIFLLDLGGLGLGLEQFQGASSDTSRGKRPGCSRPCRRGLSRGRNFEASQASIAAAASPIPWNRPIRGPSDMVVRAARTTGT